MREIEKLDRIAISVRSHRLLKALMNENLELEEILQNSNNETEVQVVLKDWIIINQLVFTTAATRRGHFVKLRKLLNDIVVLPYYTFTVKGYMENIFNFASNARVVQGRLEEKT